MLEQAGALRDAATIVLHHHEWFDGRGYPHGLAGREIPVGARIVAIADAYEAMVAGRPYRSAVAHEAALAELRRHAGIQFDPELVQLFVTLFADGVPWAPSDGGHGRGHSHDLRIRGRPAGRDHRHHGVIHDAVHARRRGEARPAGQPLAAGLEPADQGDLTCSPCVPSAARALVERRDRTTGLPYPACERDPGHGRPQPRRAPAHEHRPSRGRWLAGRPAGARDADRLSPARRPRRPAIVDNALG